MIKQFTFLTVFLTLISCGKVEKNYYENESNEAFQGEFYLSNNSFIEIFQNEDNIYINSSGQLLTSINPFNDTFSELPKLSGEFKIIDNKVKISKNFNYTSGMDVENDDSNTNITGNRRTDITLELDKGLLKITYKIYSDSLNSNANYIVANRVLLQE